MNLESGFNTEVEEEEEVEAIWVVAVRQEESKIHFFDSCHQPQQRHPHPSVTYS